MSMNDVSGGYEDWWLDELARQIHAFGRPVIVSYGEEANGTWSDWAWTRTPPQQYQAAWKHVMRVLRLDKNITWMDTLNTSFPGSGPLADYLVPGVRVIGLDAYFFNQDDTFGTVFIPTLTQIRQLTAKPILISETAAGPASRPALYLAWSAGPAAEAERDYLVRPGSGDGYLPPGLGSDSGGCRRVPAGRLARLAQQAPERHLAPGGMGLDRTAADVHGVRHLLLRQVQVEPQYHGLPLAQRESPQG